MFEERDNSFFTGTEYTTNVVLKPEELDLLQELLHHRVMLSRTVHDFIQTRTKNGRHANGISNRLRRLVDAGVLNRLKENVSATRAPVYRYYYKLAKRGLLILVDEGKLTLEEAEKFYNQIKSRRIPKIHNLATSILVNDIYLKVLKEGIKGYSHSRGVDDTRLNGEEPIPADRKGLVLPDWVFTLNKRTVCLEVDTGTETSRVVEAKVERYIKFAESIQGSGEDLAIVFSVVDPSLNLPTYRFSIDRTKRISSLKASIPPIQSWPSNLSVYVITAEKTDELLLRLLKREEPYSKDLRQLVIFEWMERLKIYKDSDIHLKEFDNGYLNELEILKELEPDGVIELTRGRRKDRLALIWGEEGSIATYQLIRANQFKTRKGRESKSPLDGVLAIYPNKNQLDSDIYGEPWENVWLTDFATWQKIENREDPFPMFMKIVSNYRKEWMPYE